MTRIISGMVGGRRLATPAGEATRPTSDRVREALFSRLDHLDILVGSRVLDLYAGSGALGLEALSRGAIHATLVDSDRGAAGIARTNARGLGFADRVLVRAEPVERVLLTGPANPDERVGLVFLDPPYDLADDRLADVLALLVRHTWLAPDALVVVERSGRSAPPRWPAGLSASGERRYGDTKVWFADAPGPDDVA
jgi:16S rRNA (guanine966-N2)-methyltransferase